MDDYDDGVELNVGDPVVVYYTDDLAERSWPGEVVRIGVTLCDIRYGANGQVDTFQLESRVIQDLRGDYVAFALPSEYYEMEQ